VLRGTSELPSIQDEVLARLIREGAESWAEFCARTSDRHHTLVPSDHAGAYEALRRVSPLATSFLEFGSGTGVVTILASLLGFESHGIELEPWLVTRSTELALRFGSASRFAGGSFVPEEYQDEVEHLPVDFVTPTGGACAYGELGLELDDF